MLRISGKAGAAGIVARMARRNRALLSGTALTAFVAAGMFSPMSVEQVRAASECGPIPAGAPNGFTVSCGTGPGPGYNSGIVYGTAQTNNATGNLIFDFTNTPAVGPSSGSNRSAVQITTSGASRSLDINIKQEGVGAAPSFTGANSSSFNPISAASYEARISNGFQASTNGTGAGILFDVNQNFDRNGENNGSGATFQGGSLSSITGNHTANGISLSTGGANSAIVANVANATINGGTVLSASASHSAQGFAIGTTGSNSGVTLNLDNVDVNGGTISGGIGVAHGVGITTTGSDSAVNLELDGGTNINGGTASGLAAGTAHGVNIVTTGANSDVTFKLLDGTVDGGTGQTSGHGVNISTNTADSDVTFDSAANTRISATNGEGVRIQTNGGDIKADGTINGTIETTTTVAGVGIGTGFAALAGGGGDSLVHVGTTGVVRGSGAGIVGTANGAGVVDIDIDGQVQQTGTTALPLTTFLPVGVAGIGAGSGSVDVSSSAGSSISQIGSTPAVGPADPIKGIGMLALNTGTGTATATANGTVLATGIGVAAIANGNTATTNVGGNVLVGGGAGVSPLGALSLGSIDLTVGAMAVSGNNAAAVNIHGGNINGANLAGSSPDIGGMAVALGGTADATVDVGDGLAEASIVNANELGLLALNLGRGDAVIDTSDLAPDNADPDLDPQRNVVNSGGIGAMALALGGGDAIINTDNSTVNADSVGLIAGGVNATVDAGTVVVANGSGVFAVALGGNALVNSHEEIVANGFTAIGAFATGNVTVNLNPDDADYDPNTDVANVRNTGGLGVLAVGGGLTSVQGTNSFVASDGTGIVAIGATVDVDSGLVRSENGSGILAAAFGGAGDVTLHNDVIANGLAGVGAFATGNLNVDTQGNDVTNTNAGGTAGIGIGAISFETATVDSQGGQVTSDATGILAFGENVVVDSGAVTSNNGSGVVGTAFGGDATVRTHDLIQADSGLFGASAISFGGNATVRVGGDIDPPLIGANAVTFGPGLAHADILAGVSVEADIIGVNAANFGTGNVLVDIGNNATIESGGVGILATKAFGAGGVTINVETGARVEGDVSGVVILAGTPGATDNAAVLNNDGTIQGNGFLSPVIFALTDGGVTINNTANGVIRGEETEAGTLIGTTGDPLGAFEPAIVTAGGGALVNNDGEIHGSVAFLSGEDNAFNNTGLWNTGGLNFLGFGGNDAVNNTGTVRTHLLTVFAGLEDFNNEGGLLTAQDGVINDVTVTTGNFNGRDLADPLAADSVLAFDATLTPGGVADLLVVGGNVTGATLIDVNDLDGGPGLFTGNDDAILFALVDGNTDTTNFYTNGGIDKGLFRYDAYLRDVPLGDPDFSEWVLASTLDREAYEFPVIGMGAQNLWHASTGTWLDRTADLRSAFGETGSGIVDPKNEGASAAVAGNVTPGAWLKLFGGTAERDFSNTSAPTPGLLGPSYTYDSKWNQDHYGFMVGLDGGRESLTASGQNQAWLVGIMGGYTGSNLDFGNSDTDVDYKVGSIGAYVTYLNGGFFADAALKADFGKIDYSSDLGGGFGDSFSTDFKSVGVTVDTGYRFNGATGWFFEPKATLSYVRTTYDDAVVLGTGVSINDADSLRGRLGARLGTQMVSNGNIIEPWLEASAWHEFKGDYTATLTSNGFNLPVSYDVGGTFGEVAGGANFINVGNGWSGFAKGAVQFGDDSFLGFSGNLGVRKTW